MYHKLDCAYPNLGLLGHGPGFLSKPNPILGPELGHSLVLRDSKCGFGRNRKNRLNAEIVFHIAANTRFGQLESLFNVAFSSRIGHILNLWV